MRTANLEAQIANMKDVMDVADASMRPMHEKIIKEYQDRLTKISKLSNVLQGNETMDIDKANALLARAINDPKPKAPAKPAATTASPRPAPPPAPPRRPAHRSGRRRAA